MTLTPLITGRLESMTLTPLIAIDSLTPLIRITSNHYS